MSCDVESALTKLRIPVQSIAERFGFGRVSKAVERLNNIKKPGRYDFEVNTANHPVPFFPFTAVLKRNSILRSTENWMRPGSGYNNFSLPTLFKKGKRNHKAVEE